MVLFGNDPVAARQCPRIDPQNSHSPLPPALMKPDMRNQPCTSSAVSLMLAYRPALLRIHDLVRDIEVRIHVLDVIIVLERINKPQHLLRFLAVELHIGLRDHGDLGDIQGHARVFQRLLHLFEVVRAPS